MDQNGSRELALSLAVQANDGPKDTVQRAEEYYKFLTNTGA
jgi:hypothetical protein